MREYRKFFNYFAMYDKTGICKYLEKKAADGWLLTEMNTLTWKFKRVEPQKLKFSVVYFNRASEYDPKPGEDQLSFREYCEHSGWTFAASNAQTLVFYTDNENTVPIETDALVEVNTIHSVMKWRWFFPYLLLAVLQSLNLCLYLKNFTYDIITSLLVDSFSTVATRLLLVLVLLSEVIEYTVWYIRAKRLAAFDGRFLSTKNYRNIRWSVCILILLVYNFAYSIVNGVSTLFALVGGILLAVMILLVYCGAKRLLKKLNVPKAVNYIATTAVLVIFVFICYEGIIPALDMLPEDGIQDEFALQYMTQEEFSAAAPLEITDLIKTETDITKSVVQEEKSLSAAKFRAEQYASDLSQDEEYSLIYTVFDIKLPFVRKLCVNQLMERYFMLDNYLFVSLDRVSYRELVAEVWGADEAYILCVDGKAINRYLLCYGNTIVELIPSWELTAEQVEFVAETFGK